MGMDSLETIWQAIHGRTKKKAKGDVFERSSTGMR